MVFVLWFPLSFFSVPVLYIYIYATTKNKESAFKLKMLVEGTQVMHYRYWGP